MKPRNPFAAEAWRRRCGAHLKPKPVIDKETLDELEWEPMHFQEFHERMMERLKQGQKEYGNESFHKSKEELAVEIEQEALDLVGWGLLLYTKHAGYDPENPLQHASEFHRICWYSSVHPPPERMSYQALAIYSGTLGCTFLKHADRLKNG